MRPEGWENPYPEPKLSREAFIHIYYDIFEAGADAMLEALSKLPCGATIYGNGIAFSNGNKYKLLFIPEEE